MTFEELSATQGTPANDTFASVIAAALAPDQPTPEPEIAPSEAAEQPE